MASYTWTGVTGNWKTAAGWTPSGGPPTASNSATINGTATFSRRETHCTGGGLRDRGMLRRRLAGHVELATELAQSRAVLRAEPIREPRRAFVR